MYLTQGLKRAAQIKPNVLATHDGERTRTWGELIERVARLAGALRDLGVVDGERAGVLSLNSDRYLEALYATVWAGGVFVPINTRLAPPEIAFWIKDSECRVLLIDDTFAPVIAEHRDTLLLVDVVSAIAAYAIDFDAHGVDFALAGINKALALPPGLCVFAASERYLASAKARTSGCAESTHGVGCRNSACGGLMGSPVTKRGLARSLEARRVHFTTTADRRPGSDHRAR